MTARRMILLVILAGSGYALWRAVEMRSRPPEVPFTRVVRERIVSTLSTNGKVEPFEWAAARAGRAGPVGAIHVTKGQRVLRNAVLVELDSSDARAELSSAEARITAAQAELEVLAKGGRAADLAEIEGSLGRERIELEAARRERDSIARLQQKDAATRADLQTAEERVRRAEASIRALETRRGSLVVAGDRAVAQARLRDAEAAAALARDRIRQSAVRAPIDGIVYQFDLKPGAYLNPGDQVAAIGKLDRVKVKVFIDEPELGRISRGLAVTITWDARPGRTWKGTVEKLPVEIVALGTRQVGEVECAIENPELELLPGTNINAEIVIKVVDAALTIPKEAVRRENQEPGVYILANGRVEWRKVSLGVPSITRTEVQGLPEGEAVALPTERPIRGGMEVRAVFP